MIFVIFFVIVHLLELGDIFASIGVRELQSNSSEAFATFADCHRFFCVLLVLLLVCSSEFNDKCYLKLLVSSFKAYGTTAQHYSICQKETCEDLMRTVLGLLCILFFPLTLIKRISLLRYNFSQEMKS